MAHIYYLLVRRQRLQGLKLPGLLLAVGFIIGWFGVWLFEPVTSDLAHPSVYWWFFECTITTLGYELPVTLGGRIAVGVMILLTVFSFAVVIADISDKIKSIYERHERGLAKTVFTGHVIVFGYLPDHTENLCRNLGDQEVVLVTSDSQLQRNPLHGPRRAFVRGDVESDDVLTRSNAAAAMAVIIDVQDDDLAFAIAVAVRFYNLTAHIVVGVTSPDTVRAQHKFDRVGGRVICLAAEEVAMLASEALKQGTARILGVLRDPSDPGSIHRVETPAQMRPTPFWDLAARFTPLNACLTGLEVGETCRVAPPDAVVTAGQVLFYIRQSPIPQAVLASIWLQ